MSRIPSTAEMRGMAIGANISLIKRRGLELGFILEDAFIDRAARWSYNEHGFGHADLDGYLEYLDEIKNKRLYNIDIQLWKELTKQVFERDSYTCQYCGRLGGKLECDHIVPISKGGTNDLFNLATSCLKCNRQKKDKSVEEFNNWKLMRLENHGNI